MFIVCHEAVSGQYSFVQLLLFAIVHLMLLLLLGVSNAGEKKEGKKHKFSYKMSLATSYMPS